jgi:hypothetical protein
MQNGLISLFEPVMKDLRSMMIDKEPMSSGEDGSFRSLLSCAMKGGTAPGISTTFLQGAEGLSIPDRMADLLPLLLKMNMPALLQKLEIPESEAGGLAAASQDNVVAGDEGTAERSDRDQETESLLLGLLSLAIARMTRGDTNPVSVREGTSAENDEAVYSADGPVPDGDTTAAPCAAHTPRDVFPEGTKASPAGEGELQILALLVFNALHALMGHEKGVTRAAGKTDVNETEHSGRIESLLTGALPTESMTFAASAEDGVTAEITRVNAGEKEGSARGSISAVPDGIVADSAPFHIREFADLLAAQAQVASQRLTVGHREDQTIDEIRPGRVEATDPFATVPDGAKRAVLVDGARTQVAEVTRENITPAYVGGLQRPEIDDRSGWSPTAGLPQRGAEAALQDIIGMLKSMDNTAGSSEKIPVKLEFTMALSKKFTAQAESPSLGNGKVRSAGSDPTATPTKEALPDREGGDAYSPDSGPREKPPAPKPEDYVLSGTDLPSAGKVGQEQKGKVLEHQFPMTSVERFQRIAEQLAGKSSGHDLTVRLSIGEEESVVLGLKDLGQSVTIEVRASHQGMISLLQTQKEAIVRHLEGKDIRTNIFIDPNASGNPERREKRETRQRRFNSIHEEGKGFGELVGILA